MARKMARNSLFAWMNGELVGRLERSSLHGLGFYYAREWLTSSFCRPISLSLPLRAAHDPWRGTAVHHFIDNLLPDTVHQRQQLRMQFSAKSIEPFDLLAEVGADCPGALQFTRHETPPPVELDPAPALSEQDIERLLISLGPQASLSRKQPLGARCTFGGAHSKTALLWHQGHWHLPKEGGVSSHILQLPFERHGDTGLMLSAVLENAWLCQRVASAFGVAVPVCELMHFGSQKVLVIERADRRVVLEQNRIICVPREDMCQAFGQPSAEKYQVNGAPTLTRIARLLLGSRNGWHDRRALLHSQLVFWMLCAFDGHAKKFALELGPGGQFGLAPPGGVLSAYPLLGLTQGKMSADKVHMALGIGEQTIPERWNEIDVVHWLALARRCALPQTQMLQLLSDVSAQALQISAGLRKRLPAGFPVAVSEPILQGVVHAAQRLRVGLSAVSG